MINIDSLLQSKRVEVRIAEFKIDKFFVKEFRANNHLTQAALASVFGVTKKAVEKWEQGSNKINGSAAVLFKLLNDNPFLLSQLYDVRVTEEKKENQYEPIESKTLDLDAGFKCASTPIQSSAFSAA